MMEAPKKILFISQYFLPDIVAVSFRISETAEILKEDGFFVKILTTFPHRTKGKDEYTKDDSHIIRVPVLKLNKGKTIDYVMHYSSFMFTSLLWGIFKTGSKIDYIIVTSPPLFAAFSGWLLTWIKKTKFVLDIRDIWPDSAVGTGHLNKSSPLYRIGKFLEYFIYRRADMITCVSEKMREYIVQGVKKDIPILVLYNGLSKKFLEDNQITVDTNIMFKDEFVISYIGNIGHAQNLGLIIDVAERLKDKDIKFNLIGEGSIKNILIRKAMGAGLKNVVFKDACSKKEAFECMIQSHALLIILKNCYTAFNLTIPSKLFDYLWANKPILYGIEGEGKEILDSLPGNLYFNSSTPESLIKIVVDLKENYNYYKTKAAKNRHFVLNNLTREKMARKLEKYLDVLDEMDIQR